MVTDLQGHTSEVLFFFFNFDHNCELVGKIESFWVLAWEFSKLCRKDFREWRMS